MSEEFYIEWSFRDTREDAAWERPRRWGPGRTYRRCAAFAIGVSAAQCSALLAMEAQVVAAEEKAAEMARGRMGDYSAPWTDAGARAACEAFRRDVVTGGVAPENWTYAVVDRAFVRMLRTCRAQRRLFKPMARLASRTPSIRLVDGVFYRAPIEDVADEIGRRAWATRSLGTILPGGAPSPAGAAYAEVARLGRRWMCRLAWSDGSEEDEK